MNIFSAKNIRRIFFGIITASCVMGGFFVAQPASAAIQYVGNIGTNTKNIAGNTSITVTVPAAGVAVGNTVIVAFASSSTAGAVGCSDNKGHIYNVDVDKLGAAAGGRVTICSTYLQMTGLVSGDIITATYPVTTTSSITANVFSGLLPVALDKISSASGNNTSPNSGLTASTTQANELLVGAVQFASGTFTFTAADNFILTNANLGTRPLGSAYKIVSATGTYRDRGTSNPSGQWEAIIATYKEATPPKLTINKACVPAGNGGKFNLRLDGVTVVGGTDKACGTGTGAITTTAGSHTISEAAGTGTNLSDYSTFITGDCMANGSIILADGDNKVCTITNNFIQTWGTLVVKKVVVNNDGGTAVASTFTMHIKSGGTDILGSPFAGSGAGSSFPINPGNYVVSENANSGYGATFIQGAGQDCDASGNVTVVMGIAKTCTVTNDDIAPILILNKVLDNTGGGTAAEINWLLMADQPYVFSLWGDGAGPNIDADVQGSVPVGPYTLNEANGPSNYAASDWVCVGGTQNGNQITLSVGQVAVCTITNTFDPPRPFPENFNSVYNGCTGTAGVGQATFTWDYSPVGWWVPPEQGEATYQIQFDDNSNFSSPEVDSGVVNGTSNQIAVPIYPSVVSNSFQYSVLYYERVKVCNVFGTCSFWTSGPNYQAPAHPSPVPSFTFSPTTPKINEQVNFTNTSVCYNGSGQILPAPSCASYVWDFGDGSATDSSVNPTHIYATQQTFNVSLQATDANGNTCASSNQLGTNPAETGSWLWEEKPPSGF